MFIRIVSLYLFIFCVEWLKECMYTRFLVDDKGGRTLRGNAVLLLGCPKSVFCLLHVADVSTIVDANMNPFLSSKSEN